jgi:outer membrane protein assembly factor BamB
VPRARPLIVYRLWAYPIVLVVLSVVLSSVLTGCDSPGATPPLVGNDWPMYGYDLARTSTNNETILNPSNIGQLSKLWSFKTQDAIAAPATVVGYSIYIGSWDGYEYSIDSQTGVLNWKTFLGKTIANPWCDPPQLGITSAPTYDNGTLYLGGGDAYWYALDAKTGHVLWKVFTGDNSATAGYYNWSSPLIYDGYAYIGTSSEGDCPLAQGKLLKVSLSEHKVVQSIDMVPDKEVGGGIWSTPVLDQAKKEIFLSTGTENTLNQINSQALLGVDLETFTIKDRWRLPEENAIIDSDFGGTPALFQTSNGTHMLICVNKNGIAYAFKADNMAAGPVWQTYIAEGDLSPTQGGGSISTAVFANNTVYMAGGKSIIDDVAYQGSVRALNPDNGQVLWVHKTTGPILGALTYSNGMIFANAGNTLEVLNPKDGTRIASYTFPGQIYDTPVVSHGQVIVGDTDGSVYDLGLPQNTPPPAGKKCGNLSCWDIANPSSSSSDTFSNDTWKIKASGNGIDINTDQLNFAAQEVSGNTQISVRISSLEGSASGQAGLMIRQSGNPGSPFYGAFIRKDNQVALLYRENLNGPVSSLGTAHITASLPTYLQIRRVDDQFLAATSTDGVHYTALPGSAVTLTLTTKALGGLATHAGNDQSTATATYEHLTFGTPTDTLTEAPSSTPCISGWECSGVGYPAVIGTQKLDGETLTIEGAGIDIGGHADQFHFVSRQIAQDGTISARLLSQTSTNPWAKAGLMIRQSNDANAPSYAILSTPQNGLVLDYRDGKGLGATVTSIPLTPAPTLPLYIKIARAGNIFSAYQSADGINWSFILGTNVEMKLPGPMQIGIAITSTNWEELGTATFDSIKVSDQAPPPAVLCPDTWMCSDVGFKASLLSGTQMYDNGSWLLQAAGADIANTSDQFHAVWQKLTNNGNVSARVTSIKQLNDYSKAGVMLREGEDPGSRFYAIFTTPQKGLVVEYREVQGGNAALIDIPLSDQTKIPVYLKVTREGDLFNAYYSQDGVNWTVVEGQQKTIPMSTTLFAGLALTSHSQTNIGTATIDSVHVGP